MSNLNTTSKALIVALIASAFVGCASNDHPYLHKKEKPKAAEWGYMGEIGPAHWGDLSPDYILAKTGRQQSPINISNAVAADLPAINFNYNAAQINLVYNGHTIEEKISQESTINVDGKEYELLQFHFHAPSEHKLNGRHTDMEMHLVHKSDDGALAVVSMMINVGAENKAFGPIWDYLPTPENRERTYTTTVDVDKLLPADRGYYSYQGSFTTPPCTEGVYWMVLQSIVELSEAQVEKFRAIIHGNNRPVQPLNGRIVEHSK